MSKRAVSGPADLQSSISGRTVFILVAGPKGGTGKSFMAKNFAVCASKDGYRVAIVDFDVQRSIKPWLHTRINNIGAHNTIDSFEAAMDDPEAVGEVLNLRGYDVVIIDMPPYIGPHNKSINSLLIKCDLTVIPTRYGWTDILSTKTLLSTTHLLRVKPLVVINAVKTTAVNALARCIDELKGLSAISPNYIADYVSFIDIDASGLGAVEVPRFAGRESMLRLWNEVKGNVGLPVETARKSPRKRKAG